MPLLRPVAQLRHWRVEVEDRVSHEWPGGVSTAVWNNSKRKRSKFNGGGLRFLWFYFWPPFWKVVWEVMIFECFLFSKTFDCFLLVFFSTWDAIHFVLKGHSKIKHNRTCNQKNGSFFDGDEELWLRISRLGNNKYWQIYGFRFVFTIACLSYSLLIHWFYWLLEVRFNIFRQWSWFKFPTCLIKIDSHHFVLGEFFPSPKTVPAVFSLSSDEGICIEFDDVVNTLDLDEGGSKVWKKRSYFIQVWGRCT